MLDDFTPASTKSQLPEKIDAIIAHFGGRLPDLSNTLERSKLNLQDRFLLLKLHCLENKLKDSPAQGELMA
jgi:hypothetical protein